MTGYMLALGPCFGCQRTFSFNPELVPSITVDGERRPVCRSCVERVNPKRAANGLPPIVPPRGAYDAEEVT